MKTLFAVDCSAAINGNEIYFRKLKELRIIYYNSKRGDKFYTWGNNYCYKTEAEMDSFISSKIGQGTATSYNISEIGRVTKNENFEHLIIVTGSCASNNDIDESDRRVQQYGLKYSFVSNYIIGSGVNESITCPFSRGCKGVTFFIDNYSHEKSQTFLSREDQQALDHINSIENWSTFKSYQKKLFFAIKAKCLGKKANSELIDKLNTLKSKIKDVGNEQNNFDAKYNNLLRMAEGSINYATFVIAA